MNELFDQYFKEKISEAELQPESHVWEQIESKRQSNKKPIWPFMLQLAASLLLILGLSTILYYYKFQQPPKTQDLNQLFQKNTQNIIKHAVPEFSELKNGTATQKPPEDASAAINKTELNLAHSKEGIPTIENNKKAIDQARPNYKRSSTPIATLAKKSIPRLVDATEWNNNKLLAKQTRTTDYKKEIPTIKVSYKSSSKPEPVSTMDEMDQQQDSWMGMLRNKKNELFAIHTLLQKKHEDE